MPSRRRPAFARKVAAAGWAVIALFVSLALPIVYIKGRFVDQYDEATYHLPTILGFASALPFPDLMHYRSATTPLYHLLMAVLVDAGCNLTTLRLINLGISVAALTITMLYFARFSRSQTTASLATLVLALNPYMLGPSVRLATDNLAFGSAVLVLYLLDDVAALSIRTFLFAVILSSIAVMTRQSYLWLVPVLFGYALAGAPPGSTRRWTAAGASLLPLIAVVPLFIVWHGFTNPDFANKHELGGSIINGRALVLAVCSMAVYAAAFAPQLAAIVWPDPARRLVLIGTCLLGLVSFPLLDAGPGAYLVPTEGGWLRAIAEHTPVVFGGWSLFWILFPLGCAVIAAMVQYAVTTRNGIWLVAAFILWLIVNVTQARAIAKYYEPFEIVVVGRFAVCASDSAFGRSLPALALAIGFLAIDVARFFLSLPWATPGMAHLAPG